MHLPQDRRTTRAFRRRLASAGVVLALAVTLGACTTVVRVEPGGADAGGAPTVEVRAAVQGELRVVRVPADRPASGVVVRSDDGRSFRIPPGHYPPPGACRVWRPDVPPGRQDAPGTCGDLERRVPPGAYLVYG